MSLQKNIKKRKIKRSFRVRNKQVSRGKKLRVSVFKSLSNIYAQIIDDSQHKTLASFSSLQLAKKDGDKKSQAKQVGLELGKVAVDKDIKDVFFDRGCYLYHGRMQALADGLREAGLSF
ncbi:MAG: 50S ribosomal protein L18 [Epsilonproteobacteria bacterium]|nr:50S ribosomal protein L18 [Campylobacterota bacterium]